MDLLKAIRTEPLGKIEDLVAKKGIPSNSKYLDYEALSLSISCGKKDVAKFLLNNNCRVNKSVKSVAHDTPLHLAVKLGDLDLVNSLLSKRASIDTVDAELSTPLHLAFLTNHPEIVDVLLSHAQEINDFTNSRNQHNLTHLHIACTSTSLPLIVQHYLEGGANMEDAVAEDAPRYAGFTAMHFAVEFRSIVAIKTLYSCRNFFVDYPEDCSGTTAPQLASQTLTTLSIACNLFEGGNLDVTNGLNTTLSLFHMACLRGDPTAMERFIENGASINTPVSKDAMFCPLYSPLHFAVESNVKANVEVLLRHGADVEKMNGYDMTPLHLALYNEDYRNKNPIVDLLYDALKDKKVDRVDVNGLGYLHVACTRNDMETVRVLLEKSNDKHIKVRPNERNFSDFTPLHFSICYQHQDLTEFLIDNGAIVDPTSLHLACEIGDVGLIQLLIKREVDAKSPRNSDGKTALHLLVEAYLDNRDVCKLVYDGNIEATADAACKKDKLLECVNSLIQKGCEVNAKDRAGNTALHGACTKICDGGKCVMELLNYGADVNVENVDGDTPFDESFKDDNRFEATDYVVLYDHIQLLKDVGLKVSKKNEECCEKMLKELREISHEAVQESELRRKQREREDEIARLKNVQLTVTTSLLDFLKLDKNRATIFAKNSVLARTVMDKNLKKTYPLYGTMLQLFYKKIEGEQCVEFEGKRKADDDVGVVLMKPKRRRLKRYVCSIPL